MKLCADWDLSLLNGREGRGRVFDASDHPSELLRLGWVACCLDDSLLEHRPSLDKSTAVKFGF